MKKLFSTPKKAIISVLCIVVVIAAVSVMAVRSSLITREEAKAVALRDAGLNEMWVHSPPLGAQANFNRIEKHDTM